MVSHMAQRPQTAYHPLLLPQAKSSEPDWKWSGQNSNKHPYGMPAPQEEA